ncbi:ImuA family protein [Mesorhizobium sp. ANAO-SY3R2]|uniref:ImuA family protein n=1 Tax=Mesorhizobium sp. ANAO-SY3R2 TaxID=3166644 RepID=UPI00366B8DE6
MATSAVARDVVFALRRKIAKIEGTLPELLAARSGNVPPAGLLVRRNGVASARDLFLPTGVQELDETLGGGLPKAALTEIHGAATRDAGAVAGFALCLASLIRKHNARPGLVLWVGTAEVFREAGLPYAPGLAGQFGLAPEQMLLAEAPKPADALWIAEEASRIDEFATVIVELRGNPRGLDLTATRRLHRRAQDAGRPVLLLRHSAEAEPTAAPTRFVAAPAPAALRRTVAGPLSHSIGPPGFTVEIGKSRTALAGKFILEWNPDAHTLEQRRDERAVPENRVAMVSPSRGRADPAAAAGAVLAFRPAAGPAAGDQPSREQHPAHRRPRRTG